MPDHFQRYRLRHPPQVLARPAEEGESLLGPHGVEVCGPDEMLVVVGPIMYRQDRALFERLYVEETGREP